MFQDHRNLKNVYYRGILGLVTEASRNPDLVISDTVGLQYAPTRRGEMDLPEVASVVFRTKQEDVEPGDVTKALLVGLVRNIKVNMADPKNEVFDDIRNHFFYAVREYYEQISSVVEKISKIFHDDAGVSSAADKFVSLIGAFKAEYDPGPSMPKGREKDRFFSDLRARHKERGISDEAPAIGDVPEAFTDLVRGSKDDVLEKSLVVAEFSPEKEKAVILHILLPMFDRSRSTTQSTQYLVHAALNKLHSEEQLWTHVPHLPAESTSGQMPERFLRYRYEYLTGYGFILDYPEGGKTPKKFPNPPPAVPPLAVKKPEQPKPPEPPPKPKSNLRPGAF